MGKRSIWIGELRYHVEKSIRDELKLSQETIDNLGIGFKAIENHLKKVNDGYYTPQIVEKFITEKIKEYHNGSLPYQKLTIIRRTGEYLRQYYEDESTHYFRLPTLGHLELNDFFESVIEKYGEIERRRAVLSSNVIKTRKRIISNFLSFLQRNNHKDFGTVEANDIRSYLFELSARQPKGISTTLPIIRKFCLLLDENNIHNQRWGDILNTKPASCKRIRTPFTKEQIEKLLNAPDRNTSIGMRDIAMMLLAARTGLRSVDIVNLKFSEIDWKCNEITIIQHKTGKALSLPLFPDVGNAISEYILKGRPESDSEYIFLTVKPPYRKLTDHGNNIVQKYMKKVGITCTPKMRAGFHSFRRAVGTQMLQTGVPLTTISQVLGHSSSNATQPYLSIDFNGLKKCALDLSFIPLSGGELY